MYEIELQYCSWFSLSEECEYSIPEWYKNGEITFSYNTISNYGYIALNEFAGQIIKMYHFKDDIMTDIVEYTIWKSPEDASDYY